MNGTVASLRVAAPRAAVAGRCGRSVAVMSVYAPPSPAVSLPARARAAQQPTLGAAGSAYLGNSGSALLQACAVPPRRRGRAAPAGPSALFTGIVQGTAAVDSVTKRGDFMRMTIAFPTGATAAVQIGASVSINGTCLTVTDIDGDKLSFDLIVETLRATNLGELEVGSKCNFERSAKMGDEIGGHHVSGHVHTVARCSDVLDTGDNRKVTLSIDPKWIKYVLPKGFIAVDGCSLTVGEVGEDWFTIYLIPETIRQTVFAVKGEGAGMNIEIEQQTQAIVDTVERVVETRMADFAAKNSLKV
mmetsp:Transcript_16257/g.51074  ORF Transcript_16257/g.51074 Transcript_16257/m.51074 type:complete len:302 (-) Transcript_16257:89-994(-)